MRQQTVDVMISCIIPRPRHLPGACRSVKGIIFIHYVYVWYLFYTEVYFDWLYGLPTHFHGRGEVGYVHNHMHRDVETGESNNYYLFSNLYCSSISNHLPKYKEYYCGTVVGMGLLAPEVCESGRPRMKLVPHDSLQRTFNIYI